jgi:predicted dehydrogenase
MGNRCLSRVLNVRSKTEFFGINTKIENMDSMRQTLLHNNKFSVKKILVFGCGSIGQRHIRNLRTIGNFEIAALRTKKGHFKSIPAELEVCEFTDIHEVVDFAPDAALICNPNSLHVETSAFVAPHVKGIFVEKPLGSITDDFIQLIKIIQANNIVFFVGNNMQFHPIAEKIHEFIQKTSTGKIINHQILNGQYLPEWHPYENYQSSYASLKGLGGGVTQTLTHEINFALSISGSVKMVVSFLPTTSILPIDVDAISDIMLLHKNDSTSQIHLDFIQKNKQRGGVISFELCSIQYDFISNKAIGIFGKKNTSVEIFNEQSYNINQTYINEMRLFLQYIDERRMRHKFDIRNAMNDMQIVEAVYRSWRTKQVIELDELIINEDI